jgi:response regulator of citrate/malate metabolism
VTDTVATAVEQALQETLRVLVCDDDGVMSAAVSDLVRDSPGPELVGVATDASSAAALAAETQPDVVLLDVRMPGGGGAIAARLIHDSVPDARLVAFSAHADRRIVLQMLRAGAVEYLVKGPPRSFGRTSRDDLGGHKGANRRLQRVGTVRRDCAWPEWISTFAVCDTAGRVGGLWR